MDIAPTPSTISPGSVIAKKRDESGVGGPGPLWNPLTQNRQYPHVCNQLPLKNAKNAYLRKTGSSEFRPS